MAVALNVLDAHARQLDADVDVDVTAQQAIRVGALLQMVAHHAEAHRLGHELLCLQAQAGRWVALPPARRMDERRMARVEKAAGSEVDAAGEAHRRRDLGRRVGEPRHRRHWSRLGPGCAHIHPDVALHVLRRVGAQPEPAGVGAVVWRQRRDFDAAPVRAAKGPAMVAAAQILPVERAVPHRHATMRAGVADREHRPVMAAAQQHVLTEQRDRQRFAPAQRVGSNRQIPEAAQHRIHAGQLLF